MLVGVVAVLVLVAQYAAVTVPAPRMRRLGQDTANGAAVALPRNVCRLEHHVATRPSSRWVQRLHRLPQRRQRHPVRRVLKARHILAQRVASAAAAQPRRRHAP